MSTRSDSVDDASFSASGSQFLNVSKHINWLHVLAGPAIFLIVLTLPVTLVTLGLFLFVLNAFCLWLTSKLVRGFEVDGLWAALFGALLVSVVSWLLSVFISDRGHVVVITRRG